MEVEPSLGQNEYDLSDFESSSGSSDQNHSSPSALSDSASAYSATSHPEWALDLGLSIPTLVGTSNWGNNPTPFKAAPIFTSSGMHTSSSNYWNQPHQQQQQYNGMDVERREKSRVGSIQSEANSGDQTRDQGQGDSSRRSLEMEFDDMINEDVCGPSTVNSPLSIHEHSPKIPSQHQMSYSHISMPAISASQPPQPQSFLASTGLALQLPPTSSFPPVAGIAPALTGGQPTPPLGSPIINPMSQVNSTHPSPLPPPKTEAAPPPPLPTEDIPVSHSRPSRDRRSSARATGLTRSASNSASSSRERQNGSGLANSSNPLAAANGVNLVSREAVQVTQLIPNQANPPMSDLTASTASSSAYTPPVKLLVLGVPTIGAKSRVETQIKISLSLVRPVGGIKREGKSSEWAEELVNQDGSVDPTLAATALERIGSWSHIRIPQYLALKSKAKDDGKGVAGKKATKQGPPPDPESTLTMDVAVVRASDPSSQIFICTNCRARELKRSLRKKDPKNKNAPVLPPVEDMGDKDEEEEKRKVVVFNAPEYVEFGTGECVLPTRVTCYCRHHKEKKGFCVTYSLRDHLDNIVATGMTPPIMITDDHKTSVAKGTHTSAAPPTLTAAAESKRKATSKASTSVAATPTVKKEKKEKVPAPSTTASGARSRRAGGRSRRGASESGDATGEEEAAQASKKVKPYDVEGRPRKRQSPASRNSPAFAMTPLHNSPAPGFSAPPTTHSNLTSAAPSRVASPTASYQHQQNSRATSPASQHSTQNSFVSALGLDGINGNGNGGDSLMADSNSIHQSPTFIPPSSFSPRNSVSTESSLPSQHQAHNLFEWRANGTTSIISTPPLSPGATTPSVHNENYNSLFSTYPSPNQCSIEPHHAPQPMSSIPSFAIPATEPLQSLTSTWAFQQALQQQQQEIAASMPPPRINRLIPGEGPVSGGIEVTILGENFVRDLTCLFGDSGAVSTHFWSTNTLVCILPPAANPGPVFVGIKGVLHNPEQGGLPLFTYKDHSDRNLLELALQVVGLKMTGRLEDASAVAMRIVGNSPAGAGAGIHHQMSGGGGGGSQDTATLAATLNAAAASAYATPVPSRPTSRRSSMVGSPAPLASTAGETRNFEGIVINFLSLLDLDPSTLPGAAPSLPSSSPPISQPDAQQHTLLHLATVLGFHRLVAFLLARGIDFDAADRNGYTALHFAALYGRVAITRHLLEAGADVSLKTFAGKTAIEIAQDRDDIDVEDLFLRAAPSPSSTTREQITPRMSRRNLVSFSPGSNSRPASLYSESEASDVGGSSEDGDESDWSRSGSEVDSEGSHDESSDWPTETEDEDADEEIDEIYHRRVRSRNASTVSLHYLLEAEADSQVEKQPTPRISRVPSTESEVVESRPVEQPSSKPILSASSSSSWLSKKLKPTVQPGLDKLQPLAGGMTNVWEKAKANRFALPHMQLPQMHIPEITAFHAMPAALTRRMSTTTRRRSGTTTSAGEETDGGEESGWEGASRHWRALYSGQWWAKTPSSPPPQYTPSDSLYAPNSTDPDEKQAVPIASSSTSTARPASVQRLSRRGQRKLSVVSNDTDDAASVAASEFEEIQHDGNDRMLWFFWIPVLLFVLTFAYLNFQVYLTPVLDTLAETILPRPLANLLA